ncbi:Transcription factor PIL1 [Hirschfeldia incana]|nr:Transcription factor PIL1 [Hirschfeldia incana]
MISPSSSFKPRLNDHDYMELVCENGQILAKSQKTNNHGYFQNQRTQSILDLYETEYDESFKKNIKNLEETQVVPVSNEQTNNKKRTKSSNNELERALLQDNKRFKSSNNDSSNGLKNVEVITAPPDEQSEAVGRSTKMYFTPSSMLSLGSSRDLSCSLEKRKCGDIDEEETNYISNSSDDESDDAKRLAPAKTRKTMAKRKRSTEVHKLSERKRRHEISKKMRALHDLLPNCCKDDKVSLLDEAIKYMRTLQLQIQMMSMCNGLIQPSMILPVGNYPTMGLRMNMGVAATTTSVPQFMPMNVQGTTFHGINNASSHMLSAFLNHPTGLIPNSPIFSPLENCSQQLAVPSCFPETQATYFSQFPMSESTSNFEDAMQFRGSSGY